MRNMRTSYTVSEKPCTPRKASWTNRGVTLELHPGRNERSARGQDGFDNLARQTVRSVVVT